MKPYNERLPLIDAAIEATDGDIERIKDYRKTDTYINYTVKLGYFSVDSQWAFCGETICTHDEYEQRASELGYKPKEQDMNDWYENGELPPANIECEVKIEGQWLPTVVVGHYANEAVVVDPCVTTQRFFCTTANNLRPLQSETDKLIEQMERSFESTGCVFTNDHRALAEHLIEQGYRKIKPMDKDEFVQDALKHFSSIRFDLGKIRLICDSLRKLHSAGCRFLDQGE